MIYHSCALLIHHSCAWMISGCAWLIYHGCAWFIVVVLDWFVMVVVDWFIIVVLDWFIMVVLDWFIIVVLDWFIMVALDRTQGMAFSLTSQSLRVRCTQDGSWFPKDNQCVLASSMNCDAPPTVTHARRQLPAAYIPGQVATYVCDPGK